MKCNKDCFNCIYDDCINDVVNKNYMRLPSVMERKYKHQREKYRKRKEAGLCTTCGKKPAEYGIYCYEHYLYHKRKIREWCDRNKPKIREERRKQGLCTFCGAPRMNGRTVCEKCYSRLYESGMRLFEHPNTKASIEFRKKYYSAQMQTIKYSKKKKDRVEHFNEVVNHSKEKYFEDGEK